MKKSSSLASAPCADAVTTTKVVKMTKTKAKEVVNPTSSTFSTDFVVVSPVSPIPVLSLGLTAVITSTVADNTSTPAIIGEEVSTGVIPIINSDESSLRQDVRSNEAAGVKRYASLLKECNFGRDRHATAKEEFREFIFARFPGEYLLKVTNVKTREILLGRTCWNIAEYPMFVAPWSPKFTHEEGPLTNAVVPVELRGVLYLLFNKENLSRLATAVGKAVDLTKKLLTNIISGFSNGREVDISVSYPWLPLKCESCGKYGRSAFT
ncbi:hypothetical protein HID58_093766 [Brassica napus]|uniref:DUF4283 domain-containing protein n=1 Tax=Brassica napus TaxID=3708 RepID=A0ABQ7XC16_BRANA|nr:hypothetical protein HID58_093766 [Brassica napus]